MLFYFLQSRKAQKWTNGKSFMQFRKVCFVQLWFVKINLHKLFFVYCMWQIAFRMDPLVSFPITFECASGRYYTANACKKLLNILGNLSKQKNLQRKLGIICHKHNIENENVNGKKVRKVKKSMIESTVLDGLMISSKLQNSVFKYALDEWSRTDFGAIF